MQIKRQGVPYEIKGPSAARLAIRSKNGKPYACHEGTRETSHTMSIVMWVAIAHPASKGDTPCTIPISPLHRQASLLTNYNNAPVGTSSPWSARSTPIRQACSSLHQSSLLACSPHPVCSKPHQNSGSSTPIVMAPRVNAPLTSEDWSASWGKHHQALIRATLAGGDDSPSSDPNAPRCGSGSDQPTQDHSAATTENAHLTQQHRRPWLRRSTGLPTPTGTSGHENGVQIPSSGSDT